MSLHNFSTFENLSTLFTYLGNKLKGKPTAIKLSQSQYEALPEQQQKDTSKMYFVPDAPSSGYVLPIASQNTLGGVKVGNNLSIDANGVLSADGGTPTGLGTAAYKDVAVSGDADGTQVVMGNDSRLTDSRNAKDVSSWAKASTKPTYTASEVGAIATSAKGVANGVASLGSDGKVPSSQLPSISGGINYSTTEQVVGKWIDGSNIYQITLDFTNGGNGYITVGNDISLDKFNASNVKFFIYAAASSLKVSDANNYRSDFSSAFLVSIKVSNNAVKLINVATTTLYVQYLTLQYVKK